MKDIKMRTTILSTKRDQFESKISKRFSAMALIVTSRGGILGYFDIDCFYFKNLNKTHFTLQFPNKKVFYEFLIQLNW